MKRPVGFLLAWCAAFGLAGCASPPLTLDPIGPVSGGHVGFSGAREGMLLVYTRRVDIEQNAIGYGRHTSYWLADPAGRDIRWVRNSADDTDPRPQAVLLEPGEYLVKAQSESAGAVRVPVQIMSSKLTLVRLDAYPNHDFDSVPTNDVVVLPDGRAAGRRVVTAAKP